MKRNKIEVGNVYKVKDGELISITNPNSQMGRNDFDASFIGSYDGVILYGEVLSIQEYKDETVPNLLEVRFWSKVKEWKILISELTFIRKVTLDVVKTIENRGRK